MNKQTGIGYVGGKPETKRFQKGNSITTFSVGVTEKYKGRDDKMVYKTEWFHIVARGKMGEVCEKYLDKGSYIYFEGKTQTRYWENNGGNKKSITEVQLESMEFLSNKRQDENSNDDLPF